tara:strand:- start:343 stop:621 length:279 start_codon:yes stop_codon:yes gene_type:complete
MQLELFPEMNVIDPSWQPIVSFCDRYYGDLIPHMHIDNFMWMYSWGDVQCYKYKPSNGSLNIDSDGKYYRWSLEYGEYRKVSAYKALKALFG